MSYPNLTITILRK